MTPNQLQQQLGTVEIVDVRDQQEWAAGHLDGSRHAALADLDDFEPSDDGARVVAVCRSGGRSATAVEELQARGIDADHLEGGLAAWTAQDYPLVTDDETPGHLHGAEAQTEDHDRLERALTSVAMDAAAHFGDREPTEDEMRAFLRQRLITEGRTPEQADDLLGSL